MRYLITLYRLMEMQHQGQTMESIFRTRQPEQYHWKQYNK